MAQFTEEQIGELIEKFQNICRTYITGEHRQKGLNRLLDYLGDEDRSDFYTAPASTRFHGAYKGGLLEHSIDVFECAMGMKEFVLKELRAHGQEDADISDESIAVAALFHDLCKIKLYKTEKRNQKINGRWEEVDSYAFDEKMAFGGHGSKSVYIVASCMTLTVDEATAINCHMGFADLTGPQINSVSGAYQACPLAWLIHIADEAATFLRARN